MFALINFLVGLLLGIVDAALGTSPLLGLLYGLAVFLPNLGVSIRRLHDTGRTGWWVLLALVPLVGVIVLLVFLALPGTPGDNEYGPAPQPDAVL
ncbi:DUF805 domain-containing protein [Streptomyces sp. NPDC052396]|uniref:DUF805 domain-containing protein n=1 Tax=Streptomyces sp. NPDC052396 TaxID=3365689 RepID=UPI0037D44C16